MAEWSKAVVLKAIVCKYRGFESLFVRLNLYIEMKNYNPTTSSQRHLILIDRTGLSKDKPVKSLVKGNNKTGGRNNQGKLTSFRKGGGHKKKYRKITFKRQGLNGTVEAIEYDPNRSAFIAKILTDYNKWAYILAPHELQLGQRVESGERAPFEIGNALPMRKIPIGSDIHNIELEPGRGAQFLRAAGTFGTLVEKIQDSDLVRIKLRSGEQRLIHKDALATIGIVSNIDNKNQKLGKAGRSRWLGKRPVVRGVAMNPVDHPHGGGEGKTSGGRHPVTPWGRLTKGPKTRRIKKPNPFRLQDLNQRKRK